MIRKIAISAVSALALSAGVALAAGTEGHIEDVAFSFEGPFGKFDEHQLQRGLQVYTEVCCRLPRAEACAAAHAFRRRRPGIARRSGARLC